MMSLCRNLAVLLLFLIASPLPHSHLFTHATSTAPATRPRIIFLTGFAQKVTMTMTIMKNPQSLLKW
ncbi:Small conductance calcium-activated potassium channel protein 2 [Dissostichus eleginoides]|uniref:Small conductance calcium-activated potassium channel protein 2 n=1 Tax=Dissostichus eleginoides TaxID=100907 RepID=A0AAD9CLL0_DISEL|nr:Small conductance calcium-activated potassium channel protein 2 [Dissostichus eleginoides]